MKSSLISGRESTNSNGRCATMKSGYSTSSRRGWRRSKKERNRKKGELTEPVFFSQLDEGFVMPAGLI
jgi:hypothetical protein